MGRAMLVAAALLGLASGAWCQLVENVDERVVAVPGAPLVVTSISAGRQVPNWAPEFHQQNPPRADRPVLPVYLQVQNNSKQLMFAYRIVVVAYDPFGDWLDTYRLTAINALAPGGQDYGRWSVPLRQCFLTWTLVAYVEAVRYQDGTVWRCDQEQVAGLMPSAAPVRYQTWHTLPQDPRDYILQQPKDPEGPVQ